MIQYTILRNFVLQMYFCVPKMMPVTNSMSHFLLDSHGKVILMLRVDSDVIGV